MSQKSGTQRSNHVVPSGRPSNPIFPPLTTDNQDLSSGHPDKDSVTLELVRPDDAALDQGLVEDQGLLVRTGGVPYPDRCVRRFEEDQNLGAVAAVISEVYDLESKENVALYPSSERSEALSHDTTVDNLSKSSLHWEVIAVEAEV